MMGMGTTPTPELGPTGPTGLEITVVDGSAADRHGTELVLRSWGHRVIGRAASFESALDAIGKRRPQVALVAMELSDGSGMRLVRRLLASDPGLGIVLMLAQPDGHELEEAMACGARGIVLRTGQVTELASAVAIVAAGGRYVPQASSGIRNDRREGR
jgi:DNA-binding NarL/FixJ family response regulator